MALNQNRDQFSGSFKTSNGEQFPFKNKGFQTFLLNRSGRLRFSPDHSKIDNKSIRVKTSAPFNIEKYTCL